MHDLEQPNLESLFENRPSTSRRARYNEHQPLLQEIGSILSEANPLEMRTIIDNLETVVHDANRGQATDGVPSTSEESGGLIFSPHKVNKRMRTAGDSRTWRQDKTRRKCKSFATNSASEKAASLLENHEMISGQVSSVPLSQQQKQLVQWYQCNGASRDWDTEDFQILMDSTRRGSRAYLTDAHLMYAMVLLQKQFPCIGGLQETYRYRDDQRGFNPVNHSEPYLQLCQSGGAHWVCLTNRNSDGSLTKKDTVNLYDSMVILNPENNREPHISPSIFSQVAQMLKSADQSYGQTFNVKLLPCTQQSTSYECGLYAIANAVTIANGKSPSEVVYTGSMREEFLNMIMNKQLQMFEHVPKDPNNHKHRFLVHSSEGIRDKQELKPMEVAFDTVCYCQLPKSWGDLIECNECARDFHQECHMIGVTREHDSIGEAIGTFLCYSCRKPGKYNHQIEVGSPDQAAIEKASRDIDRLRSSALARCYETMMALKRVVPMTIADYQKLEEVMFTYDFNSIIQQYVRFPVFRYY